MRKDVLFAAVVTCALLVGNAGAAISYTVPGGVYSENFDSLPVNTRTNANIETGATLPLEDYTDGWQDDVDYLTTPEDDVSVPGWHLYHETQLVPTSTEESGFNGYGRYRQGNGASGTGSFYGFSSGTNTAAATNPEKALGVISSNTITPGGSRTFIALELVNNTGTTLTSFTLTYTGEQWRNEAAAADPFEFAWALNKTDTGDVDPWALGGGYTADTDLNFAPPNQAAPVGALDGNLPENRTVVSDTVNLTWAPGDRLWLRWRDTNQSGNDDGIAIDDVTFSAVPEPAGLALLALAAAGVTRRGRRK